jgi:L-xylulokinase
MEWFSRYEYQSYKNIVTVLFCKDFVNYMLCGTLSTDYSDVSAAGVFDNVNRKYQKEFFSIFNFENIFPRVIKSTDIAGRITKTASVQTGLCEGTIVCGGSFDAAACSLGSGAWKDYSVTTGTWSINAAYTDHCIMDRSILQCNLSTDGEQWFAVESSPTSAVNLEWFIKNIKTLNYEECDKIAGQYSPDSCKGIYLPYVHPMPRYPYLKEKFYGNFNNDNDKLRVLYEGIAFGHKFHLENLQKAGIYRDKVRLSGGLSRSAVWRRILADVLELPVETSAVKDEGAYGAALCAGTAASVFPSLEEAVLKVAVDGVCLPDESSQRAYRKKYSLFQEQIEEENSQAGKGR